MKFTRAEPCGECPFLKKFEKGYELDTLEEFAAGAFPCHKTAELVEDDDGHAKYHIARHSTACAGALIFNEKRNVETQAMQIAFRLGLYDPTTLNMEADVR